MQSAAPAEALGFAGSLQQLTDEGRRRHLAAHANELAGEIDEGSGPVARDGNELEQRGSKLRDPVRTSGQDCQISPRIQIVFYRKDQDFLGAAAILQLLAIGIFLPPNPSQEMKLFRSKGDQVATAAMIRAENNAMSLELLESERNIARAKTRAIATDGNDLLVT